MLANHQKGLFLEGNKQKATDATREHVGILIASPAPDLSPLQIGVVLFTSLTNHMYSQGESNPASIDLLEENDEIA